MLDGDLLLASASVVVEPFRQQHNGQALIVTGREALRFAARPTLAGKPLQIAMV
jgi:hypothetical protein